MGAPHTNAPRPQGNGIAMLESQMAATAMLIVSGAVLLTDGQALSVLAFAS